MEKLSRNNRIIAITKMLVENPRKLISLNVFTEMFGSAKSTISEDIVVVRETLRHFSMGQVETVAGASGGIRLITEISEEESKKFANDLCEALKDKNRITPGNFMYVNDIMYNPKFISIAGKILASKFNKDIDYVVTVETKGIPLAYEVARCLGVELIIVRRENKVTEGATVIINYVSGSSGRIQNMCLSKKSMKTNSKCIFIDDFLRGGGTTLGIIDLLKEFNSELVGIGVLVDNTEIDKKLVHEYVSILEFEGIDEGGEVKIKPSLKF